ncbi:MAG: endonuclease [Actinoplanes sp.]|jgi:endonuclease-8|nr:endonuclease [Actinoplanes sp.]
MPEGDTVWNTARVVERALVGDVLTGSDFRVPQLATTDLAGWTVAESASRGKHLLLRLTRDDRAMTLHSHLRMDGAWRAYGPAERWTGRPAHLIRVVLRSRRSVAVGYHLHELTLIPTAGEAALLDHLGPDLLGADWDPAEAVRRIAAKPAASIAEALLDQHNLARVDPYFSTDRAFNPVAHGYWVEEEAVRRLARQPQRALGEALLDQENLAGIGNVYASELSYLSGVHPLAPVEQADLGRVVRLARRLLLANRGRWDRVTTGDTRRDRRLWVYGRQGRACLRCETLVVRATHGQAPQTRPVYWCPLCQGKGAT